MAFDPNVMNDRICPLPAKPKRKLTRKQEAFINNAYNQFCAGIQVPMLDIPKIWKAGEDALLAGGDLAIVGAALKAAAEASEAAFKVKR